MRARELTDAEQAAPLGWRYEGRYAIYDVKQPLTSDSGYFAIEDDDGELAGFGCMGQEARVPGIEATEGTVDIGYGMRPDLIGRGRGRELVAAVCAHVDAVHPDRRLRMSILHWNGRSRRVAEAHGFHVVGRVGEFDVLVREADTPQIGR